MIAENPLRRRDTTKFGKVVKRKLQHATSLKTKEMFYRTTFVVQTFFIASKPYATRYNNIQHDTTTYNKVVKRYKLFLHNKCCTLLYEKLGSFDRDFRKRKMRHIVSLVTSQWRDFQNVALDSQFFEVFYFSFDDEKHKSVQNHSNHSVRR